MRKLTAGLFHSLDGVVEAPHKFQFDSFDAQLGAAMTAMMAKVDTVLMGRIGFKEWAGYWPQATTDLDFAGFINTTQKFVASRTLRPEQLNWENSTLIEGDLIAFVQELKTRPGGEISLMGGISLVRELLFAGLLDSLTLMTHPVVAGSGGRHLFEPGDPATRLDLQSSQQTEKGNMILTYGLRA